LAICFLAVVPTTPTYSQPASGLSPAVPVEPIPAIVDAFRSHAVVTFSDPHGVDQLEAFELSVVSDPRIRGIVNDVVIENGNARYQDLMDKFVRGETVPYPMLRRVWDETTQPQAGITTGVPALYRTIRDVNAKLPPAQQLRVLLGDPPIDWDSVRNRDDYDKWFNQRDTHPADLIQREVLAKKRHALVVYGQLGHTERKNVVANYETEGPAQTLISRLERRTGIRAFTIWWSLDVAQFQADAVSWPVPSLALIHGTTIGATDFGLFSGNTIRVAVKDGKIVPIPKEQWRTVKSEDLFDAILYLGGPSAVSSKPLSPSICSDKGYVETRLARMTLIGLPRRELERLKNLCGLPN
jgi:hypothetical protein